tara:strand:+ start:1397 stop:1780 length:384 start_codon:yes stop_codon:yes gene_type:complete
MRDNFVCAWCVQGEMPEGTSHGICHRHVTLLKLEHFQQVVKTKRRWKKSMELLFTAAESMTLQRHEINKHSTLWLVCQLAINIDRLIRGNSHDPSVLDEHIEMLLDRFGDNPPKGKKKKKKEKKDAK